MRLAHAANVFGDGYEGSGIRPSTVLPRRANHDDMPVKIINDWKATLKDITQKQITGDGLEIVGRMHVYAQQHSIQPLIRLETGSVERDRDNNDISPHGKDSQMIVRPILEMLNEEQKHAHDIIESRIFGGESKVELSHTAIC